MPFLLSLLLFLTGCGAIEDMIENATERTITISQDIQNSTIERSSHSTTLFQNVTIVDGQTLVSSPISLEELDEAIDASRLGIVETRFYLGLDVANLSGSSVFFAVGMAPNTGVEGAVQLVGVNMSAYQSLLVGRPALFSTEAEALDQRIKSVTDYIVEDYFAVPAVQAFGGSVAVDLVKLICLPTYYRHEELSLDSLGAFNVQIDDVHDVELLGSVANLGTAIVELRIYLSEGDTIDLANDLVAQAFIEPGQKLEGDELLIEGGEAKVDDAFEKIADGKTMHYDYTLVSTEDIVVESDNLRVKAEADVKADIF